MVDKDYIPTLQQIYWLDDDLNSKLFPEEDYFLEIINISYFDWGEPKWFVMVKEYLNESSNGRLVEYVVDVENSNGKPHPLYLVDVEQSPHGYPVPAIEVCKMDEEGNWKYEDENGNIVIID